MKYTLGFILFVLLALFLIPAKAQEAVKDYDGNVYKTVKIGTSVWMAENLKVTHYSNGELIPDIKESKQWDLLLSGAYCDLNNNPSYSKAFGLIYNWYTIADVRNVCPAGWHVPSENEWVTLVSILAGENRKSTSHIDTSGKISPGLLKLNESVFKVLPEGFRGYDGEFTGLGYGGGGWWSGTECTKETAFYHNVDYNTAGRQKMEGPKRFAYNIRCIKDSR
jgi:uncharacterized protein (TIGR02145 family)